MLDREKEASEDHAVFAKARGPIAGKLWRAVIRGAAATCGEMDAAGDHAADCVAGVASPSTPQAPKVAAGMRMSVLSAFQIESKPSTLSIRNSPTVMPRRESTWLRLNTSK